MADNWSGSLSPEQMRAQREAQDSPAALATFWQGLAPGAPPPFNREPMPYLVLPPRPFEPPANNTTAKLAAAPASAPEPRAASWTDDLELGWAGVRDVANKGLASVGLGEPTHHAADVYADQRAKAESYTPTEADELKKSAQHIEDTTPLLASAAAATAVDASFGVLAPGPLPAGFGTQAVADAKVAGHKAVEAAASIGSGILSSLKALGIGAGLLGLGVLGVVVWRATR